MLQGRRKGSSRPGIFDRCLVPGVYVHRLARQAPGNKNKKLGRKISFGERCACCFANPTKDSCMSWVPRLIEYSPKSSHITPLPIYCLKINLSFRSAKFWPRSARKFDVGPGCRSVRWGGARRIGGCRPYYTTCRRSSTRGTIHGKPYQRLVPIS